MIRRRVFYSFHYAADSWRAATIRNMGRVEGNQPATGNQWEEVARGGHAAIRRWIDGQMKRRTCTVVLVGARTAGRTWIDYEIKKSWGRGMGLVGIHIHDLLDRDGYPSHRGRNPFGHFTIEDRHGYARNLSSVVKCYNPSDYSGYDSKECYAWIRDHLADIVEDAIRIRNGWP